MYRSIETSHKIREMNVAINTAIETIENTEITNCSQAPEQQHQHLQKCSN